MTKYIIVLVVMAVSGLLFIEYKHSLSDLTESADERLPVQVLAFRTDSGWGYEIDVNGKAFIHQNFIPAIEGNKCFQSSEDALRVGNFVLQKMKNKQRPVVTMKELKELNIKDL